MNRIIYTARGRDVARSYRAKKSPAFWGLAGFILVLAALGAYLYVFELSEWQVSYLAIRGAESLNEDEVRSFVFEEIAGKYAPFFRKDSIFLVNTKTLESKLREKFPVLAAVSIKKNYPKGLELEVKERELWGIFCSAPVALAKEGGSGACAFVDKTGFAYEQAPDSEGPLITKFRSDLSFEIPSQVIGLATSKKLSDLAEKLGELLGAQAVEYRLFSKIPDEARLRLNEGFEIYFDLAADLEGSLRVLETVLRDEIKEKRGELEYIDLRFGNKVFYKLR